MTVTGTAGSVETRRRIILNSEVFSPFPPFLDYLLFSLKLVYLVVPLDMGNAFSCCDTCCKAVFNRLLGTTDA